MSLGHGPHPYFGRFRMWTNPLDDTITRAVRGEGTWARFEMEHLLPLARAGDLVVDIGANIGCHTVLLSERVGPHGQVLAFEPEPVNHGYLVRNLRENSCGNVVAEPLGLTERDEMRWLQLSSSNLGAHSLEAANVPNLDVALPVRCTSLDAYLRRHPVDHPVRLIKLDIQGAEAAALTGAMQTIVRDRPFIFCEYEGLMMRRMRAHPREFFQGIADLGYAIEQVDEWAQVRRPIAPAEIVALPDAPGTNLLFTPS